MTDAAERLLNNDQPPKKRGPKPGSKSAKVSSVTTRRVLRTQNLVNEGRAPINVMLRNMWWWDELANNLGTVLMKNSEDLKFAKNDEEKFEALKTFNDNLEKFFRARDKAQDCAVDAAPYFHARLQHVKVDASMNVTPSKVARDAPDEKFVEGYATLVNQSYRVDIDDSDSPVTDFEPAEENVE
jgi:hypothetical protein